jgi:hypothetical protein
MRPVAQDPYWVIEALADVVDDIVTCLDECRDDPQDIDMCITDVRGHVHHINKLVKMHACGTGEASDDDWEQ